MSASRVLVTGAGGFLGRNLCRFLAARGFDVVAHGRTPKSVTPLKSLNIETVACDLENVDETVALTELGRLDAVVHCAGLSSNWGKRAAFYSANVGGTENLLSRIQPDHSTHLIHVSSSSVCFAFRDCLLVKEDDPLPKPVNDYAWSKALAEATVRKTRDFPATIIRPRGIYGLGDTALLPRLLKAAERGPLPLFHSGRAVIDLTHVEDVASAVYAVLQTGSPTFGKTYNVSGGEPVAVRDIIEKSAARAGATVTWRPLPWAAARFGIQCIEGYHRLLRPDTEPVVTEYSAGLLAFSQTLDISAIARDTGWRPHIRFAHGLELTFPAQGCPPETDKSHAAVQ
jgi:nucleoside-diphosphate-sugar epimerase